jgi:hypothetical protein
MFKVKGGLNQKNLETPAIGIKNVLSKYPQFVILGQGPD